jgi:hypothetical protein
VVELVGVSMFVAQRSIVNGSCIPPTHKGAAKWLVVDESNSK